MGEVAFKNTQGRPCNPCLKFLEAGMRELALQAGEGPASSCVRFVGDWALAEEEISTT